MKNLILVSAFLLPLLGFSQEIHNKCGVGLEEGYMIKQRMLDNRANVDVSQFENLKNRSAVTYIPVTIHFIGDDNGEGYGNYGDVFATFCAMNELYLPQNVQFYIKFPLRYVNSQDHHEDMFSASQQYIANLKVDNTLNIFTGKSTLNPYASFYTSWGGDWLFLLTAQAQGEGTTLAHELGHLLTLPHPFYGWEDIDARDYEGGPSPSDLGGWNGEVEKFTRGTGKNCYSAGDGFCDTPADYISFIAPCPMTYDLRDPSDISIDPDENNIMSYYYDECVTTFSQEQQDAIMIDIIDRQWDNFSAPASLTDLAGTVATQISPINNNIIPIPLYNDVTLTWDAVAGAEGYYLIVERTYSFGVVQLEIIIEEFIMDPNAISYSFSGTLLIEPEYYRWSVTPINEYKPCAEFDTYEQFTTTGIDSSAAETGLRSDLISEESNNFEIYPNPARDMFIISTDAKTDNLVVIYNTVGQIIFESPIISRKYEVNVTNWTPGVYIVELGTKKQRVVVN